MGQGNRGKKLEELIDKSNKFYEENEIAKIVKIPHPFRTVKYDKGKVTGFFENGYLLDYMGVCNGIAHAFDAKETKGKSLPLDNIKEHQLKFIYEWENQNALSYILVWFSELNRYFAMYANDLRSVIDILEEDGKKSINIKYFENYADELFIKNGILEYL